MLKAKIQNFGWGAAILFMALFWGTSFNAMAESDSSDQPDAAPATSSDKGDLTGVSLENLMGLNVQVVSSSKKAESLRNATSAIYVITQEDIQNSGFQHVADLMRMVPGVQVAQQSSNQWAISARGFNGQFNNKMLVLVDGRSVYDPVMGGVDWNQMDLMLEDIDHIEVIRGPGGTLWGSNAVNGVINIITKDAKLTQGVYLSSLGGESLYPGDVNGPSNPNSRESVRYGGKLGDDLFYRVYIQNSNWQPTTEPSSGLVNDSWNDTRAGFRADYHKDQDQLTFEGEALKGYYGYENFNTGNSPVFNVQTGQNYNDINTTVDQHAHLLGHWTRNFNDDSEINVTGYYDYTNTTTVNDSRITNVGNADLEFQHRFDFASVNEITWGGSFRNTTAEFYNPIQWYYTPANQSINIYGGFLQDRLTLSQDHLYLTGGAKLEDNPYTGLEFQPSGRLLFTPDAVNSFWAGVSRSVRIPTITAESSNLYLGELPANAFGPGTPSTNLYGGMIPNSQLVAEVLVSYELGYRTNPTKETSLDIAGFYNHYDNLISLADISGTYPSPAGGSFTNAYGPVGLILLQQQNTGVGNIYGFEVSAKWDPFSNFHLSAGYTYQNYDQDMINASNIELGAPPPHNMVNGRVNYEPVHGLTLNSAVYFTDTTFLYDPNTTVSPTPAYTRWDLGATLKVTDEFEVSTWGQNLNGSHQETLQSYGVTPVIVVPSVYAQATIRY